MAASISKYQTLSQYIANGTIDLDTDTFKVALFASTSNAATLTNSVFASLTNELATANGYTAGGITLSGVTYNTSAGTATFTASNPVWTASGGSIVARFAVIYKSGTANAIVNPVMFVILLDTTPADVTTTTGNTLTLNFGSGIFTVA